MSGPRILTAAVERKAQLRPSFSFSSCLLSLPLSLSLSVREEAAFFFNDEERAMAGSLGLDEEGTIDRERERERERGYTPAAPAVEVVQALLVACSRTYTLDRTFDLGSRGIADDLGSYVTGYVERDRRSTSPRNGELDRPGEREFWYIFLYIYIYFFKNLLYSCFD